MEIKNSLSLLHLLHIKTITYIICIKYFKMILSY